MSLRTSPVLTLGALALLAPSSAPAQEYDVVLLNGHVIDPESMYDEVANVGLRGGHIETVQELLANSAVTGAHMHLRHVNSTAPKDIHTILPMIEAALERGVNFTVGAHPLGAASTFVGAAMFSGDGWRDRMGSTAANFQLGTEQMTEEQLADSQASKPGTFIVWHFLDETKPDDLARLDASVLHPNILIESGEMLWMFMDDQGEVEDYDGDAWPLPEGSFSHPRSNGTFAKIARSWVNGAQEILANALALVAPVSVSHFNNPGWRLVHELISRLEDRGSNVWGEIYPYAAGSTTMNAVFRAPEN